MLCIYACIRCKDAVAGMLALVIAVRIGKNIISFWMFTRGFSTALSL